MPTLDWIGKDKVINHHLDFPCRVLECQYSYDKNGQHTEDNGNEIMIKSYIIYLLHLRSKQI